MLDWMESGKPFSLICVAYDRQRRTGGHLLHIDEARIYQPGKPPQGVRPATRMEYLTHRSRSPAHGQHYTRNIQVFQEGQPTAIIKKIHPPLIISFNEREVLL